MNITGIIRNWGLPCILLAYYTFLYSILHSYFGETSMGHFPFCRHKNLLSQKAVYILQGVFSSSLSSFKIRNGKNRGNPEQIHKKSPEDTDTENGLSKGFELRESSPLNLLNNVLVQGGQRKSGKESLNLSPQRLYVHIPPLHLLTQQSTCPASFVQWTWLLLPPLVEDTLSNTNCKKDLTRVTLARACGFWDDFLWRQCFSIFFPEMCPNFCLS